MTCYRCSGDMPAAHVACDFSTDSLDAAMDHFERTSHNVDEVPELTNPQTQPGYDWHRGNSWVSSEPRVDWNDRDSIICWLCWNDRNGSYTDDDARAEDLPPLTLDEARQYMIDQAAG